MTKFQAYLKAYVEALRNGDDHDITNAAVDVFDNWDDSHPNSVELMRTCELEADEGVTKEQIADAIEGVI